MLKRNIPKIFAYVICFGAICVIFSACLSISSNDSESKKTGSAADNQKTGDYKEPKVVGTIDSDEISESSGLVNSPCQPEVLWTHNDSGGGAFIFALDKTGKKLATFKVADAKNTDWEDLAIRKERSGCFLYIGEIGNNSRSRGESTVYRVKEPSFAGKSESSKKNPLPTEAAAAIKFEYPDSRHDAETLLVHPESGDIYVLTKGLSGASAVYKLKAGFDSSKTNTLEKIADFTVPAIPNGLLTGGSISPDGKRVVVCDYFGAYEIVLPKQAKNFDEIWKQKPQKIELGQRAQGEAIAYAADGKAIYATSEEKDSPLIEVKRK